MAEGVAFDEGRGSDVADGSDGCGLEDPEDINPLGLWLVNGRSQGSRSCLASTLGFGTHPHWPLGMGDGLRAGKR